jgi:hypothetical protein
MRDFKQGKKGFITKMTELLLLPAEALLKGHELLITSIIVDVWSNLYFLIFQVGFDLALSIWLLSGIFKRIKWLVVLVCFTLFCSVVGANPKIVLSQDVIDFGAISINNAKLSKEIYVENEGTKTLEIKFINSTCGCTQVKQMDEKIAPGEEGKIIIEVALSKMDLGIKKQMLYFKTNDSQKEYFNIEVNYRSNLEEVAISPKKISVELSKEELSKGTGQTCNTIIIVDNWEGRLKITDIQTSPNLTTSFYDILYRCEKGTELHFMRFDTRLSPKCSVGKSEEYLRMSTNHPDYPSIEIPIVGTITSPINVFPKTVIFRKEDLGTTIYLSILSDEPFEITSFETKDKWLLMKRIALEEKKRQYVLSLDMDKINESTQTQLYMKSQVKFAVLHPDVEEVVVDVYAFLK